MQDSSWGFLIRVDHLIFFLLFRTWTSKRSQLLINLVVYFRSSPLANDNIDMIIDDFRRGPHPILQSVRLGPFRDPPLLCISPPLTVLLNPRFQIHPRADFVLLLTHSLALYLSHVHDLVLNDISCEIFICEITRRAWLHAEENKRRTLQRSDVANAVSRSDQFDFLIDIVPREEPPKPSHKKSSTREDVAPEVNYRNDLQRSRWSSN